MNDDPGKTEAARCGPHDDPDGRDELPRKASEFVVPQINRTDYATGVVERSLDEMEAKASTRDRFWTSPGSVQAAFIRKWLAFKEQAEQKGGPKGLERIKTAHEKRRRRMEKRKPRDK